METAEAKGLPAVTATPLKGSAEKSTSSPGLSGLARRIASAVGSSSPRSGSGRESPAAMEQPATQEPEDQTESLEKSVLEAGTEPETALRRKMLRHSPSLESFGEACAVMMRVVSDIRKLILQEKAKKRMTIQSVESFEGLVDTLEDEVEAVVAGAMTQAANSAAAGLMAEVVSSAVTKAVASALAGNGEEYTRVVRKVMPAKALDRGTSAPGPRAGASSSKGSQRNPTTQCVWCN
ncbi:hypothetical protein LSTR_LSTR015424 [Laodelphax striatellus]|uniref:Uncharacterized protein n=1 Tax=Laodelphax striatellus TaxID=195883 RepID=A0A482X8V2_LAOST|nr:hypothetical protein LSTR_LSTR015424 [Laodelphax striatellus]